RRVLFRSFISRTMPMLGDPAAWRLRVDGLVAQPLELSLDDLMRMPRVSYTVKHHCVEGWSAIASWHGVPVSAIVEQVRPTKAARSPYPSRSSNRRRRTRS